MAEKKVIYCELKGFAVRTIGDYIFIDNAYKFTVGNVEAELRRKQKLKLKLFVEEHLGKNGKATS